MAPLERKMHEVYLQNKEILRLLGGIKIPDGEWVSPQQFIERFNLSYDKLAKMRKNKKYESVFKVETEGKTNSYKYSVAEYIKVSNHNPPC